MRSILATLEPDFRPGVHSALILVAWSQELQQKEEDWGR